MISSCAKNLMLMPVVKSLLLRVYMEAINVLNIIRAISTKVVCCVLKEICEPDSISDNNYRSLVEYSTVLEHNYNRLWSMNLEHEMSNHSIMWLIIKSFPCSIEE